MMTCVCAGVLALSTAGWAWKSLEAIRPPTPTWQLNLDGLPAAATPMVGESVTLLDTSVTPAQKVGAATISSVEPGVAGRAKVVIAKIEREVDLTGKRIDLLAASNLYGPASPSGQGSIWNAQIAQAQGIPAFQIVLLQASAATIILLVGGMLTYFYVGRKASSAEFLISTDGEMRKVNWSTKKIVIDSTYVVIAASVLIAAFIFLWDVLISNFFKLINVVRG
jgi:preprotein translocase SecE subunit